MERSTISQHIDSVPGRCGGRPCIAGTRIRVLDIYVWHMVQGMTADEIVTHVSGITLADVHAALAYCYDHRAELREEFDEERRQFELLSESAPSKLSDPE